MRQAITAIAVIAVLFTATCGGQKRNEAPTSALTPLSPLVLPSKTASVIPADVRLVARDAGIALSAGGYTLSWEYENPGDYGQDGIVALEDIAPLSEHFNETATFENEWIDGSGNGKLGIEDVTPLAMNWASEVTGYRIDGAEAAEGPWSEVAQVELTDADATGGRLAFSQEFAPGYTYYRIVTLTPDGDAASSEALVAPSNEPIIYDVTPLSGYQHEEYTFTATASGQEPLTYAWDFGGGASPNTSSDISPTVTLSDAGEYSATLTISNSYGPTTFPFTLTVSARDTWAHTWGGFRTDTAVDMAVDEEGNLYIVAETESFGAGSSDLLLLKYTAEGDVLWARTWGTVSSENIAGGAVIEDRLLVIGHTNVSGDHRDDIVFLEYDLEGNLLSSRTFGGDDYDRVHDIFVDPEGSIYLAGELYVYAGDTDMLVAKFAPDLTCLWARAYGGTGDDRARSLVVTADGSIFVACNVDKLTEENDIGLLKYSSGGEVEWAVAWDSGVNEGSTRIVLDGQGNLCLLGGTNGFGAGDYDILLTTWDANGQFLAARTWGAADWDGNARAFFDPVGKLYIGAETRSFGPRTAVVLRLDTDLSLSSSVMWNGDYTDFEVMAWDHDTNLYATGYTSSLGGHWEEVEISGQQVEGTVRSLWTDDRDLAWSERMVDGVVDAPEGEEDTGAGSVDVMLAKNILW